MIKSIAGVALGLSLAASIVHASYLGDLIARGPQASREVASKAARGLTGAMIRVEDLEVKVDLSPTKGVLYLDFHPLFGSNAGQLIDGPLAWDYPATPDTYVTA
jgi:hypothetical protein